VACLTAQAASFAHKKSLYCAQVVRAVEAISLKRRYVGKSELHRSRVIFYEWTGKCVKPPPGWEWNEKDSRRCM